VIQSDQDYDPEEADPKEERNGIQPAQSLAEEEPVK